MAEQNLKYWKNGYFIDSKCYSKIQIKKLPQAHMNFHQNFVRTIKIHNVAENLA